MAKVWARSNTLATLLQENRTAGGKSDMKGATTPLHTKPGRTAELKNTALGITRPGL
jgi:hypothetical protein